MLLDEVTSALDPELVSEVLDLISELAEAGMTMLIATHEMGFARDIASRVCFLADGQYPRTGSARPVVHPAVGRVPGASSGASPTPAGCEACGERHE